MPPEEQNQDQHHDEPVLPNAGLMMMDQLPISPSSSARVQQPHTDDNDDADDDDDDSYHDLDAVLALVAASESSAAAAAAELLGEDENNNRGTGTTAQEGAMLNTDAPGIVNPFDSLLSNPVDSASVSAAAAAPAPSSSFSTSRLHPRRAPSEESKEEMIDDNGEEQSHQQNSIPRNVASAYYSTAVEEASVILESAYSASLQQTQQEEDARLAAAAAEEEELLLALKRSVYEGGSAGARNIYNNTTYYNGGADDHHQQQQQQQQQEATVLEITDERYDAAAAYSQNDGSYFNDSANAATTAHAEWIGQDYSNNNTTATSNNNRNNTRNQTAAAAVAVSDDDEGYNEQTQEATVIDSAPLEKNQDGFTEEAQVLLEEQQQQDEEEEDSKPAARDTGPRADGDGDLRNHGMNEEEAEVLGIQERGDIHPVEFASVDAAEDAELVRTDYSYTVALPSTSASAAESASVTATPNGEEDVVSASQQTDTPRAMAVVDPSMRQAGDTTTNLTTASAVHEDTHFSNTEQQPETTPVEHAQVLESESSGTSVQEDLKPAAEDDIPNHDDIVGSPHHPSRRMRRSLSAIAEQEGEVVSIQEDHDLHPEVRAENQRYDSEAEFLGTDDSMNILASASSSTAASYQEQQQHPVLTVQSATAVSATRSPAAADHSRSVTHPTPASSGDGEAQVVSIQEVRDLHPAADGPQHRSSGVDAELVGEVQPAAATLVNNDQARVFTEPSILADSHFSSSLGHPQTTASWVDRSSTSAAAQSLVQTASAFVDPHQPNAPPVARRRESDNDLRAALAAIDAMEQGEHLRDLSSSASTPHKSCPSVQDAVEACERGQSDLSDEYSLEWLRDTPTSTPPDQQRIGSGTNETSNGSSGTGSTRSTIHSVSRSTAAGIQHVCNLQCRCVIRLRSLWLSHRFFIPQLTFSCLIIL